MDAIRQRFLTDRVLTATPAQRVAMLYDRLALDLARARTESAGPDSHLDHAARIVAELRGSLDVTAGGPADNLAAIYDFMLREIMTAQLSGVTSAIAAVEANVWTLREAWVAIAAGADEPAAEAPLAAASWTA